MQIPIIVEIHSPLCVRNCSILMVPRFPANHIAVFAGMQYLAPMRPAVVAPNCFGATMSVVAPASATAAVSLRCGVIASHRLVSFLLAAISVATNFVSKRFVNVSCWTVVLLVVAASAKLSKDPTRASITTCAAGSMTRLAA